MGRCTEALVSQIKSSAEYTAAKNDGIALLKIINEIMNNFKEFQYLGEGIHDMIKTFSLLNRGRNESMPSFQALFPVAQPSHGVI